MLKYSVLYSNLGKIKYIQQCVDLNEFMEGKFVMEKLNPLVDFAFKKLFGVEENKELLIDLINAVVSEKDKVTDLTIKNPYNEKAFRLDKLSILDIKAQSVSGKWYNIEMQIMDQDYYDIRALYYWSRIYNAQLLSGINYDNLEKTISINFLNFNCLDEKKYHNIYKIQNIDSHSDYSADHLEIHFIELKKYHETFSSMLDKWTNFLIKADNYSSKYLPKELQVPTIEQAIKALEHISLSPDERESYEGRLKWLRDEELALKKATRIGLEDGIQIGIKKGIEKGIEKGISRVALSMKKLGISTEQIIEATGLSKLEIEKL